jgi:hypothetical protein
MGGVAHKLFLALAAAVFRAHEFAGGEMGAGVEPAGQAFTAGQGSGLAGEVGENTLGDIVREVSVTANLPQSSGIDEIDVPPDELSECYFGPSLDVLAKQFIIWLHINF